jgi:glycyl-tRNA synthetase alpha chain
LPEEQQLSEYSFNKSDPAELRAEFESHERQAKQLLEGFDAARGKHRERYPLLATYDHCLKCSHLFNLMDARGVISVTERAALMARVRSVSCKTAAYYLEQIGGPTVRRDVRQDAHQDARR